MAPARPIVRQVQNDQPLVDGGPGGIGERAFVALRSDIVRVRLQPGTHLRVEDLRARYGFGATPLREALYRLSAIGLVESNWQRGFRVTPVSEADLTDVTAMRARLEVTALRDSIENGDRKWESTLVAAHHTLSLAERALPQGSEEVFDTYLEANGAFHEALVAACRSPWTLRLRSQVVDHQERYGRISLAVSARRTAAVAREHRKLKDAALCRDVEAAATLCEEHIFGIIGAVRNHVRRESGAPESAPVA